jgi:hypothetical protein
MTGVELIAEERQRQVDVEGWTEKHDDLHTSGQIAEAARCYLEGRNPAASRMIVGWPWLEKWWKPSKDPVRNLVKAGALIAAEIDRLQRLQ